MKKLRFGFKVSPGPLQRLDETIIRQRLYGDFRISAPRNIPDAAPAHVRVKDPAVATNELTRLRKENKHLHELVSDLARHDEPSPRPNRLTRSFPLVTITGFFIFSSLFAGITYSFLRAEARGASPAKVLKAGADCARAYTLQIAVYNKEQYADRIASLLSAQGYPAFTSAYYSAYGRIYYRVCVGRYASSDEAKTMLADIKTTTSGLFEDGFVRQYSY
jgi:hypothetical protein